MRIKAKVSVWNYELVERRKKLGYTQALFAVACGMETARLGFIETLKVKPTEEEARDIAELLNCKVSKLFPDGYEKVVDIFKRDLVKIADIEPLAISPASDEHLLLLGSVDAELTVKNLIKEAGLTEKEARLLEIRSGKDPMTLEEAGKVFGVTRERIRQLEAKMHEKIRSSKVGEEYKKQQERPITKWFGYLSKYNRWGSAGKDVHVFPVISERGMKWKIEQLTNDPTCEQIFPPFSAYSEQEALAIIRNQID